MDDSLLQTGVEPAIGAHLVARRALYTHHGIYVGGGRVIHYAGLAYGWRDGPVEETSLEHFAHGQCVRIRHDRQHFGGHEVVARARSRLGERRYRILTNNCEHFCAWAMRGEASSGQVDRLLRAPRQALRFAGLAPR